MSEDKMCTSSDKKNSQVPAAVGKHLDAIQFNKDGQLFFASSNLTYRYWTGSLWCYDKPGHVPNAEECKAGVETTCGIHDLQLIPDTDRLITAADSGGVEVWQLADDCFSSLASRVEHDNIVNSVSLNATNSQVVSASYDRCIKIWDMEEMTSIHTYKGHSAAVWNAAFHPTDPHRLVSCSQDGQVLMWDLRKPKPATRLDVSALEGRPSQVAWQPGSEQGLAVGTDSGHLLLLDGSNSAACRPHTRAVTRMAFSPNNPTWLATTSEDGSAVVTEYTAGAVTPIYEDRSRHSDMVQGVAWHPTEAGLLYTCSWDGTLAGRPVEPSPDALAQAAQKVQLDAMDCTGA